MRRTKSRMNFLECTPTACWLPTLLRELRARPKNLRPKSKLTALLCAALLCAGFCSLDAHPLSSVLQCTAGGTAHPAAGRRTVVVMCTAAVPQAAGACTGCGAAQLQAAGLHGAAGVTMHGVAAGWLLGVVPFMKILGGLMSVAFDGGGGPTTAGPHGDGTTGPAPHGDWTYGRGPQGDGSTGPRPNGVAITGAGGPAGIFATRPFGLLLTLIGDPPGGMTIRPSLPRTTSSGPYGEVTTEPIGPGMTLVGPPGIRALSLPDLGSVKVTCMPQGDATTQ